MEADPGTVWALLLEYDGGPFVGWQRQDSGLSVQEVVEAAAAHITRGAPVRVTVAGRTDAGVHAAGQVASLALPMGFSPRQVRAISSRRLAMSVGVDHSPAAACSGNT